jgi:hypothetical protein
MASKANDDRSTPTVDPWWFLNPDVAWLARRELTFVAQWTYSERAARTFLRDELAADRLPWYADISTDVSGDQVAAMARFGLAPSITAVLRGLWARREYPDPDWESSSAIYVGPLIRLQLHPDKSLHVVFDGRVMVRYVVSLLRFHHPSIEHRLRQRGLMPGHALASPVAASEEVAGAAVEKVAPGVPTETGTPGAEPSNEDTKTRIAAEARRMKRDGEIPEKILKTTFAAVLASKAGVTMKHVRNHLTEWGLWPIATAGCVERFQIWPRMIWNAFCGASQSGSECQAICA